MSSSKYHNRRRFLFLGFGLLAIVGVVCILFPFHQSHYNIPHNYEVLNTQPMINEHYNPPPFLPTDHAVVSSLYSNAFAIAVAVLGHSVRSANVTANLVLPYLEDHISTHALCIVRATGWHPYPVPFIAPPHNGKGIHHRFRDQYTKLNLWSFDTLGIKSLVYLDADTLVRRNFNELFDTPFNFAAVPDVYPQASSFNAGVLVLRPSSAVFEDMKRKIETAQYPLEQAEQAFLNLYYAGKVLWLPYAYNGNIAIKKRSPAEWAWLEEEMRVVHYTMVKPFLDDSRPLDEILTPEHQEEVMRLSAAREGGFYANEVGWWREAYERMQQEKGDEIAACIRSG